MPQDHAVFLRSSKDSFQRARTYSLKSRTSIQPSEFQQLVPRVPLEILEVIIEFFVTNQRTLSSFPAFAAVAPLTLVSSDCRLITLRHFLYHLPLDHPVSWDNIWSMIATLEKKCKESLAASAGFKWTRSIAATSHAASHHSWRLSFFCNLKTLCIDLSLEGLGTQHSRITQIFAGFEAVPLSKTLTSLCLSGVPRIDVPLLRLISERFSALTHLRITSTERLNFMCCFICLEDSLTCTRHSPVPDFYPTAEPMAVCKTNISLRILTSRIFPLKCAFSDALKPLKNLRDLHLGVFLCDEQLVWTHMDHANTEPNNIRAVGEAYECELCWPFSEEIRRRELTASLIIARRLKSLEVVTWDAFYGVVVAKSLHVKGLTGRVPVGDVDYPSCEHADDDSIEHLEAKDAALGVTSVWIWRGNGRLKVKAIPWA